MNQRDWQIIVSGKTEGFWASLMRFLLEAASIAYRLVIHIRNLLYSKDFLKSYAVTKNGLKTSDKIQNIPVISIGNITVGGTGKTPLVIWLCNLLRGKNINCAILTRGYKTDNSANDEPGMLAKNCSGTSVIINPDRLAGAIEAVKKHKAQVLIMDDGFQHRRLRRDIDIITIDALRPFGFGKLLPAGLLREPVSSLKRAHAAVITRCDLISKDNLTELSASIKKINPDLIIAQAIHKPVYAVCEKKQISLDELKNKNIFAFCGIANPEAFLKTIGLIGANITGSKIYDDHHNYTWEDINEIYQDAAQCSAQIILTTEKDYNKISQPKSGTGDLFMAYLAVRMQFSEGEDRIKELIERSFAGKIL